jgi:hypothetical protein
MPVSKSLNHRNLEFEIWNLKFKNEVQKNSFMSYFLYFFRTKF